jgi:hypothetical protein
MLVVVNVVGDMVFFGFIDELFVVTVPTDCGWLWIGHVDTVDFNISTNFGVVMVNVVIYHWSICKFRKLFNFFFFKSLKNLRKTLSSNDASWKPSELVAMQLYDPECLGCNSTIFKRPFS